ncbi:hypothetical protein DVS28_b0087 (plasmid) [Euzebya pacifica]|uniref:Uncharacterized protein n=1 Tax=Euzebya pacifica TaxID=1608957 RepID=A0A346Y5W0_9ACTN|nr:hypothetical protein [Euzebya pacifica]AXV09857.1 hypothetical protein DVS28_b0087 [Euzebya pacifica]
MHRLADLTRPLVSRDVLDMLPRLRPNPSRRSGTGDTAADIERAGRRIGPFEATRADMYRVLEAAGGRGWPGTAVLDDVADRLIAEGLWTEVRETADPLRSAS